MAKIFAVTNAEGTLLGTLRADPVDIGNGMTIHPVPLRTSTQMHHLLEVPDDLVGKPAHEIHRHVRHQLTSIEAHKRP
jgi:hypothetical protein